MTDGLICIVGTVIRKPGKERGSWWSLRNFSRETVLHQRDGPFFAFRPDVVPKQHVRVKKPVVWRTDGQFRARRNRWCWF